MQKHMLLAICFTAWRVRRLTWRPGDGARVLLRPALAFRMGERGGGCTGCEHTIWHVHRHSGFSWLGDRDVTGGGPGAWTSIFGQGHLSETGGGGGAHLLSLCPLIFYPTSCIAFFHL